jgi:hypothetical protein
MSIDTSSTWQSTPGLLFCAAGTVEATVVWAYSEVDPFAIHVLTTIDADTTFSIVFARDLLLCGLRTRVGLGDVEMGPGIVHGALGSLWFRFSSPIGNVIVEVPREPVAAFAFGTYDVVPPGRESDHLDIDDQLRGLLT